MKKKNLLLVAIYIILSTALMKFFSHLIPGSANEFVSELISEVIFTAFAIIGVVLFQKTALLKPTMKGFGEGIKAGILLLVLAGISALTFFVRDGGVITATGGEVVLFLIQMLLIGVSEEVLFRALLQNTALEVTGDDTVAKARMGIVLGAVVFGLGHLGNITSGVSVGSAFTQAIMAIPLGAVLGAIYFRGNLLSAILIHAVFDGCNFLSSGVLSGGSASGAIDTVGNKSVRDSIIAVAFYVVVFLIMTRKSKMEKAIEARKAGIVRF